MVALEDEVCDFRRRCETASNGSLIPFPDRWPHPPFPAQSFDVMVAYIRLGVAEERAKEAKRRFRFALFLLGAVVVLSVVGFFVRGF